MSDHDSLRLIAINRRDAANHMSYGGAISGRIAIDVIFILKYSIDH
jgi:hypothetical protein